MAKFLATRVMNNYLKYNNVPASIRETVKDELIKMGGEDYIDG